MFSLNLHEFQKSRICIFSLFVNWNTL